jgi:hypothetical protein
MEVAVRKIVHAIETIHHDGGPTLATPVMRGWIAVVVANPYAGRHVADITDMMEAMKPLGLMLARKLVAAFGDAGARIDAYGKGAIVGAAGELEHSALWHVPGGYGIREALGRALAIVPSAVKMGALGTAIDLPLHHKDACYVRSHFDAVTASVPDAPRANEIVYLLAMATGGRPHARVGGLEASGISKWDGQR